MSGGGTTISTSETRIEALQIQSSAYGVTLPVVYGLARLSGNMLWYGDFKAVAHTSVQEIGGKGGGGHVHAESTTYTYSASVIMGLCEGPATAVYRVWRGKKVYASPAELELSVAWGNIGQSVWPYLSGSFAAQALGYSGIHYVYGRDYDLAAQASVENHSFEVQGLPVYGFNAFDASPVAATFDLLTNTRYGAAFPIAQVANMDNWYNYCQAAGLGMSLALTEQITAAEFITRMASLTNTAPIWAASGLKFVPYGDTALVANGASYTPNNTPLYDLADDDFCPHDGGDPVRVQRKPQADAYNSIKLEWHNRANYYNLEIAQAKDSASIDAFGLREAAAVQAHWVCDPNVAQTIVQLLLQREINVRNTYEFSLPWTKALLEPMDLVTLTDSALGFSKLAVRIIEVNESENDEIDIVAEDFPLGAASATLYPNQVGGGFQHNYAVDPGSVSEPVIFEAPSERTSSGLEVYAAVSGNTANWGGCGVWVSVDGTNYKRQGTLYGGARYGYLTAAMGTTGNAQVLLQGLGGQLLSGSALDAAALSTLCWVAGVDGGEYFSFQTASLTGSNAYTLSGLVRAAYLNTLQAHAGGAKFVRVDDALAKSGPLTGEMIGQTLSFKFTSFNLYGAAEQSLANVPAFAYTVTGAQAKLPPPDMQGLQIDGAGVLSWAPYSQQAVPDLAGYVFSFCYGNNPALAAAAPLHDGIVTESPWLPVRRPGGQVTLFGQVIDTFGVKSRNPAIIITDLGAPVIANVLETIDFDAQGYPGTLTGATVSGGDVLATVTTAAWAVDTTLPAWAPDTSLPAWPAAMYATLQYTTNVVNLGSALKGSAMTLQMTTQGSGLTVEYRLTGPGPAWPSVTTGSAWPSVITGAAWPAPGPWLAWPGQLDAQNTGYQLRITLDGGTLQGRINTLALVIDAPDIEEQVNDLVLAIGGTVVPHTKPFTAIKSITVGLQAGVSGAVGIDINKSNNLAPVVRALNNTGAAVAGASADFRLKGY